MIILAFLQNLWVKEPDRVKKLLELYPDKRNIILKKLLFKGGKSGRVIRCAFGPDLIDKIIFDECTKEIAGDSKTICPPDNGHISYTINMIDPDVIVTFGNIAYKAVSSITKRKIIKCMHPAARHKHTFLQIKTGAAELRELIYVR